MKSEAFQRLRKCARFILVLFVFTLSVQTAEAKARVFRAGAATSNITPPLDEPIVGNWSQPPAQHVHDELHARCLVLDDGTTRLALVLVDNVGIPREVYDAAKVIIQDKTGIPAAHVLCAATHTHSSISARGRCKVMPSESLSDYQLFVGQRIADGVRRAVNHLEPARIGWGRGTEPNEVFNRRYFMKPGTPTPNPFGGTDQVVMNPGRGNPDILRAAGPTDPAVPFLAIQTRAGRPLALLANYALHYVGPRSGATISADYFGVFADRVQQLLGADRLDPPFVGMLSNGASGDINNINWLKKHHHQAAPYEQMNKVAQEVAQTVYQAYQTLSFHDWVELGVRQTELTLAVRKPTPEEVERAQVILDRPDEAKSYHSREKVYAQRTMLLHESPDEVDIILQAFRIGDLGVCAIPFEVFVEIGLELKQRSPWSQTMVVSHANGSYGYLPTEQQHQWGGYETWMGTCNVEVRAASKIVSDLLTSLNWLKTSLPSRSSMR